MYHRGPDLRGRSAYSNGLYTPLPPPPPSQPRPGPYTPQIQYHNYNHQGLASVSRFNAPFPERLPAYEWKPTQPTYPVYPTYTPTMANGRKRQFDDHSPHVVKRQRLEPSPHPSRGSPIPRPLPTHRPELVVARSSRCGFEHSCPNPHCPHSGHPHSHPHSHTQVPAVPENSLLFYAKDKLSGQMVELFEACQQQYSDLIRKETCRSRLQEDIQRVYAVARLYLTGSSMNGLGCRSSDADLCLVIQGNKRHDPITILAVLQRMFRTLSYVERTQLIRAKVPILRFREKDSDLEFDLNINNTVGIRNTFLLKTYAYADVRIRPLILVVKKWAQHNLINDASKGTLSSYTLVLMVLHYLQTLREPVLPCLQRDYPECFNPFMDIDLVPEGPKNIPPYNSRNQSSLAELLLGFLKYYATDFRWDTQVISVREAKALPKNNSHVWRNKYICVEEPFERNNVARAVHEKPKFEVIKAQFVESWRILQRRRDLDTILPVRDIINKEASRS